MRHYDGSYACRESVFDAVAVRITSDNDPLQNNRWLIEVEDNVFSFSPLFSFYDL